MTGMSDWMLAGSPLWIWLVALMWLANVAFPVFACRSYLAARAASRVLMRPLSPHLTPASGDPPRANDVSAPEITEPSLRDAVPVPLMVERFDSTSLLVPADAATRTPNLPVDGTERAEPATAEVRGAVADEAEPAVGFAQAPVAHDHPPDVQATGESPDANMGGFESSTYAHAQSSNWHLIANGHDTAEHRHAPDAEDALAAERFARDYRSVFAEPQSNDMSTAVESSPDAPPPGTAASRDSHPATQADAENGQESAPDILLAALRRIQEQPESARPFRELIRALYLDQSVFTFDCLADLPSEDRQLALALLKAWLAGTYEPERWEDAFQDSQLDSLSKEMFAAVPNDKAV